MWCVECYGGVSFLLFGFPITFVFVKGKDVFNHIQASSQRS